MEKRLEPHTYIAPYAGGTDVAKITPFPVKYADHGREKRMERINLFELYQLGCKIQPLRAVVEGTKIGPAYVPISGARNALKILLNDKILPLTSCGHEAQALLSSLDDLFRSKYCDSEGRLDLDKDWSKEEIGPFDLMGMNPTLSAFEHVFQAELRDYATYYVPAHGAFDTKALVDDAKRHIPTALMPFITESAVGDYNAAGKCFAFGLFTASGFHALRAVEVVLEDYYNTLAGEKAKACKSWNDYVKALDAMIDDELLPTPDPKTARNIRQVKDLDRNPLMHPRETLDETDALVLFNIATNAIISMATELAEGKDQHQLKLVENKSKAKKSGAQEA